MRLPTLLLALVLPALAAAEDCPAPPDHSAARARLVEATRAAPDAAEARRLMDQLWRIWTAAPDARAQALLDHGMARREAYDFDAALAAFDDLVAYCPAYAEGWNQRAFIHFLKTDYALALEDLEAALVLAPDHIAALAGQALTLMNLGRTEAGQSVLRQALALNPWLPERGMLIEPPGEDL
jgi:tetratricopeptide (TPR) repeat protein